ncbi:hypothetical protein F4821DRAFT_257378 [Hypoxylon rubiginosum]|uniref:Uncharacterized protein n=1 Tax=Hypoxylon rubiginosum TaxID=110542 RepID=A0ACC0D944_9PEZI|nr:hypothetical protein F4821DRAFT_257378 [Hypoxylon rubiginosum]
MSAITLVLAVALTIARYHIVDSNTPIACVDDVIIGFSAAIGTCAMLFEFGTALWLEDSGSSRYFFLAQLFLILSVALIALLGLMSLILSTVAVNYTALGSCLEHWDKPLAGDTLKECWTHGLPSALDRAQLALDIVSVLSTVVLFIVFPRPTPSNRNGPTRDTIANVVIVMNLMGMLGSIIIKSTIRQSIRTAEPFLEVAYLTVAVGEQNLSISTTNVLPIAVTMHRRSAARRNTASIPLQELSLGRSSDESRDSWSESGSTIRGWRQQGSHDI